MDAPTSEEVPPRLLAQGAFQSVKFVLAASCIGWFWIVGLPWLGQWPPVRQHVDRLNAQRVNAAAMFYTELEPMIEEGRGDSQSDGGREASK